MTAKKPAATRGRRADARRNEQALLDAAAAVFVHGGVEAPVRDIAARAGVGMGTIYRHFPTRADLVVAVFRYQLDALAQEGAAAVESGADPYAALRSWIAGFADFLVTKHGLAEAMHSDRSGFERLHAEFIERLEPVCRGLLEASAAAGRTRGDVRPIDLMQGVGNLCIGAGTDSRYDAHRMIEVLLDGLAVTPATHAPAGRAAECSDRPRPRTRR